MSTRKKQSINPIAFGFVIKHEGSDHHFLYIKNNKVVAKMYHVNWFQGLPYEWAIVKVVHCINEETKEHTIFEGNIPTEEFGRELIKNLNI